MEPEMNLKPATLLVLSLGAGSLQAQDIVPRPAKLTTAEGRFVLSAATAISATGAARAEAEKLRDYLRPATGFELPIVTEAHKGSIALALDPALAPLGDEGYTLDAAPGGVTIKAAKPAGLFYAVQSLRQLLPPEIYRAARAEGVVWSIPAVHVEDRPRFGWRGSHLDVGRHFMSKAFVLKHLELMAQHKLNVFHWHLTEDQGWRLEIKKYPKLTEVGAWRKETVIAQTQYDPAGRKFDGQPHGGFYTQEDVKEVVAFAAARHITVVPEIEMPGHARAAIASYPELGNFPDVRPDVAPHWGIIPVVFSVEDRTISFLKDVLDEVLVLFPSPFIHVGGDECPKVEWAKAPSALARMKQLKLVAPDATPDDLQGTKDANGRLVPHPALHKLQSWFIAQMDAYLTSKGRRLVGWDEILEGGLAPGAAVMSWRGEQGGIEAASQDHDVVMAPHDYTYLDYSQVAPGTPGFREPYAHGGLTTLERIYSYDPIPAQLAPDKAKHVLGSQAQMWTEYTPTEKHVEYMLWPRLAAMAEVVWTPKERKDFADFKRRNVAEIKRLETQDVNCRHEDGPRGPY
jgi:hexosaminidase